MSLRCILPSNRPRMPIFLPKTAIFSSYPRRSSTYQQTPPAPQPTAPPKQKKKKLIIAITGATGTILGIRLLQLLKPHHAHIETHLILSKWAMATLKHEAPSYPPSDMTSLADYTHSPTNLSSPLSSGSYLTHGMIVVPCSMKTLSAIRNGYDNDLIARAAGLTLKERRRLVLVVRETPLSDIYLENMLAVSRCGAVVFPPVMAFYQRPSTVEEVVAQSVGRMVDLLDLGVDLDLEGDLGDGDGDGGREMGGEGGGFERWRGFDRERGRGRGRGGEGKGGGG